MDSCEGAEDPTKIKGYFVEVYKQYKAKSGPQNVANTNVDDLALDPLWRHQAKKPRIEESEATLYLAEPVEAPSTNPLDYWKLRSSKFPVLAAMARDYLAVPATSCPSERLFSAAGNVISSTRSRLNPETARALLCLKSWYKSGLFDK